MLSGLFTQALALCAAAGLVKLGHVSLDSTKIKANASKHKAMSYGRMKERIGELSAAVDELLKEAEQVDEEEDCRHGKGRRGDELPKELGFKQARLARLDAAREALEAHAREEAAKAAEEGRAHPGVPGEREQINFTDAESKIMPAPGGKTFVQAYNCQAVVDSAHQVIVAARATNQSTDVHQAAAMIREAIGNVGAVPREMSADAGYYSAPAVRRWSGLEWRRSSPRTGPVTGRRRPRRHEVGYRRACRREIG